MLARLPATFAGMALSGILCGILFVTALRCWRRLAKIEQDAPPAV
jgi:hypothetical protein